MTSVLIIKTSSLGDIIQSLHILEYLHHRFPNVSIDWAVAKEWESIVSRSPLVRRAIPLDLKNDFVGSIQRIREEKYDLLFDLQGNCKSGLLSLMARAKEKVGFGFKTAREWPAALTVQHRIEVDRGLNIRLFNLELLRSFFGDLRPVEVKSTPLSISEEERALIESLLLQGVTPKIMVCLGSKWPNKRPLLETMRDFLAKVAHKFDPSFYLMWGSIEEKRECEALREAFPTRSCLVDKLPLPVWQNLMGEMDLLIAVDSGALHLCATTKTPSFSFFGPTSPSVFKPLGDHHFAFAGPCPYNVTFIKQCPRLRTCPTGACIKNMSADEIFDAFCSFVNTSLDRDVFLSRSRCV